MQVMGSSNAGEVGGVTYDHVFDVQIDQPGGAVATLQIGYNASESPEQAAQRFIDEHMLPVTYLRQISDYIVQASEPQQRREEEGRRPLLLVSRSIDRASSNI